MTLPPISAFFLSASNSPRPVTLKLDIEVRMLRERQLEHWRVGVIIQDVFWDVAPIQGLPYLIRCLRVAILDQSLKSSSFFKGGQLVNKAKSAKD